jgi:2Fe-2S ferredoxin
MVRIKFMEYSGSIREIDCEAGCSIMRAAVDNDVAGIVGDCGGSCACATCHVYIDKSWIDRIAQKSEHEAAMLEFVVDPGENSRLACQISVSADMDGLIVHIPRTQYEE